MDDLLKFQQERMQALENRNAYLEKELKQARQILQDLINDWEVNEVESFDMDNLFQSPTAQLNSIFKNMYK